MRNPYSFGTQAYYAYDLARFNQTINKLNCVPWLVGLGMLIPLIGAILSISK